MAGARTHVLAFVVLAALVGSQLALRAAHLPVGVARVTLGSLGLLGSCGVVAYHMNLRSAPRALKLLFVLPLVLPLLLGLALVAEALHPGIRP